MSKNTITFTRKPNSFDVKFGYGSRHFKTLAKDDIRAGKSWFKENGVRWYKVK